MFSNRMVVQQPGRATDDFAPHGGGVGGRPGGGAVGGVWARPGMAVTFRAELMPGRASAERTFRVTHVLPSRRVLIEGITGEHTAAEFELKW